MLRGHAAGAAGANQHNEVVLDTPTWVRNLPSTIEGVFRLDPSESSILEQVGNKRVGSSPESYEDETRAIHANFMRAYGLDASSFPLMVFRRGKDPPFVCDTC